MCAATATAADPKGLKRICPNCGTRYFDLNKRPIACPNCSTEFKVEPKGKGRGRRAAVVVDEKRSNIPAEDESIEVVADEETVSLAEVEEAEEEEADEDIDALDPDLDIADEEHEGEADLEEEEEDAVEPDLDVEE